MASNITYTQFILQQQQYITQQQQFLEKIILNLEENQKTKQLEEEVKTLKIKLQHVTAYSNKQYAQFLQQIKVLKRDITANREKIETVCAEVSLFEPSSQMLDNIHNTSLEALDPNEASSNTVGEETGNAEQYTVKAESDIAGDDSVNLGEMDEL